MRRVMAWEQHREESWHGDPAPHSQRITEHRAAGRMLSSESAGGASAPSPLLRIRQGFVCFWSVLLLLASMWDVLPPSLGCTCSGVLTPEQPIPGLKAPFPAENTDISDHNELSHSKSLKVPCKLSSALPPASHILFTICPLLLFQRSSRSVHMPWSGVQ